MVSKSLPNKAIMHLFMHPWINKIKWSGRQDLNLRPSVPKTDALPGCATPRHNGSYLISHKGNVLLTAQIIYASPNVIKTVQISKLIVIMILGETSYG